MNKFYILLPIIISVLSLFWANRIHAEWLSPPMFDTLQIPKIYIDDPSSRIELERYRVKLEHYRRYELEKFNNSIIKFNDRIEKERVEIEKHRVSGKISYKKYKELIAQYNELYNTIYPELLEVYKKGLKAYRSGIIMYKEAIGQIEKQYVKAEKCTPEAATTKANKFEFELYKTIKQTVIKNKIQDYLITYFSQRNGDIQLTESDDDSIELFVTNIKSEVINDRIFWEKIQIIIYLYEYKSLMTVRGVLDGQYSAGIRPPAIEGYSDMEPRYKYQLDIYANKLLINIKEDLITFQNRLQALKNEYHIIEEIIENNQKFIEEQQLNKKIRTGTYK